MPKVRKANWTEAPDPADYEAAADYLSLLVPTETAQLAVVRLRNGTMVSRRAQDLLRASGLADLPAENPSVARKLKDLKQGKLLSPVLCLRGDLHDAALLTTADGYHGVCASYLLDEGADIPCRLAELPRPDETVAAVVPDQNTRGEGSVEHDATVIVIKALLGGTMVSAFAVVGHVPRPKWFAGLFAAAPSVAVASLVVTVVDKGHHDAALAAYLMVFGAVGFVAFSTCVRPLLTKTNALAASSISCVIWVVVAVGSYLLVVG